MPKSSTKTGREAKRERRTVGRARRRTGKGGPTGDGKAAGRTATPPPSREHSYIVERGEPAFVLVPVDEYEEFVKASMVAHAIAQIESGDNDFVDADDFALELAAEKIVKARKAKGLTQKQLGAKLRLPQSQISRIERNPDRTTVRTLKRIARALGVDVSSLV